MFAEGFGGRNGVWKGFFGGMIQTRDDIYAESSMILPATLCTSKMRGLASGDLGANLRHEYVPLTLVFGMSLCTLWFVITTR